jgi:hypothetical protein
VTRFSRNNPLISGLLLREIPRNTSCDGSDDPATRGEETSGRSRRGKAKELALLFLLTLSLAT